MIDSYAEKLHHYIVTNRIAAEQLCFAESCHSVAEAAAAAGVSEADLVKSICLIGPAGELTVAIVLGEERADLRKVGKLLGSKQPRLATPAEMLELTGYPCGGTPPFGFTASFIIDERVFEKEIIYAGGGSASSLVRLPPQELVRINGARRARVGK